jgi:hypothetical protein
MKNGPRGQPSRSGSDGGRIMMAILGKGSGGQAAPLLRATPQPRRSADFNEPEAGRVGAPMAPFVPSASSGCLEAVRRGLSMIEELIRDFVAVMFALSIVLLVVVSKMPDDNA